MKTNIVVVVMVALGVGALVIGAGASQEEGKLQHGCNQGTLRGAYGFQFEGTRPIRPPFPAGVESFPAIAIRTYDGDGSFTQISNVRGAVVGVDQDVATSGTYDVNEDCS